MTNKIQTRGVLRPIEPEVYTPGEHDILVCCPFVESSFSIMHIVKGENLTIEIISILASHMATKLQIFALCEFFIKGFASD